MTDTPLACTMAALTPEQRDRRAALAAQLTHATTDVRELADGYQFLYTADESLWMVAAEFVSLERRCCPFFAFALELWPDGAVALQLTGPQGVKAFIVAEITGQ